MNVAVLFERSGVVRDAFLYHGHNAVSADLEPSAINSGRHYTVDVTAVDWSDYDLIIAHPPCTAVAVSGNRYYAGTQARRDAVRLIDWVWSIPVDRLCIENPVGQINRYLPHFPKPQYIQPWQFGHAESKRTGLWKRGLPDLQPTNVLPLPERGYWDNQTASGQNKLPPSPERAMIRARTYGGIADAMATQWGAVSWSEPYAKQNELWEVIV